MNIFFQETKMSDFIMQFYISRNVGLIPVFRMLPALRHHALRRKIKNIGRLKAADTVGNSIHIAVYIQLFKSEWTWFNREIPFVGKIHHAVL